MSDIHVDLFPLPYGRPTETLSGDPDSVIRYESTVIEELFGVKKRTLWWVL